MRPQKGLLARSLVRCCWKGQSYQRYTDLLQAAQNPVTTQHYLSAFFVIATKNWLLTSIVKLYSWGSIIQICTVALHPIQRPFLRHKLWRSPLQSCGKTFLLSSKNQSQNASLVTWKKHYSVFFQQAIPKTWQECFYTTLQYKTDFDSIYNECN